MFQEAYREILLTDRTEPADLQAGERFVAADLADFNAMRELMTGIDAVVHLGGHSIEGEWDEILQSNIIGLYNTYEAARLAGVSRIVFATSNHAVGFYPRSQTIDNTVPPKPDSRYGVSKVFGEALGSLYSNKHGMRVTDIRIGNVGYEPLDKRRLSIWLHPEDLVQLIRIGLEHPDIEHETVYGMSDNKHAWWDNSRAAELGYKPKHKSEDFAAEVLARNEAPAPIADAFQGGTFCADEYTRPR